MFLFCPRTKKKPLLANFFRQTFFKMKNFFKRIINITILPPLLILILAVFLSWQNYSPGTILSGWDTLHPEFNFSLAFERALNGVWRSEQGVGAIAAHSHMADLPRIFFLWISSFFSPGSFLRYFYFFITLAIGPIGVYVFLRSVFSGKNPLAGSLAALIGATYYLFNLGTVQHYYVPFEMFAAQYAALPWVYWSVWKYLEGGRRESLLLLFLISLLATPQAFAAMLFYVHLLVLVGFLVSIVAIKRSRVIMKRAVLILTAIFSANAFWIFPNIYSILKQSDTIKNASVNVLFSPEAFLRNQQYGTLSDILLHRNFLFSWREYNFATSEFVPLLNEWQSHLDKVQFVGYAFAGFFVAGVLLALIRKNLTGVSMLLPLGISLVFLINSNPPFERLFEIVQEIPVMAEALRTPYTKVSISFIFIFSFYVSFAFYALFLFAKKKVWTVSSLLVTLIALGSLFYFAKPMFTGSLISPSMRVAIPEEYFEMFEWFRDQPQGRIAKFPVHTKWGWVYHNWGFQGAGFTSFGTRQPQLDRDFDRWNLQNETFYNEISAAVYSSDVSTVEKVLAKYNVKYIVFDESVIDPGNDSTKNILEESSALFASSERINLEGGFGDFLKVYSYRDDDPFSYSKVASLVKYSRDDSIYTQSEYVFSEDGLVYPFANTDARSRESVSLEDGFLRFSFDYGGASNRIVIPDFFALEEHVPISTYVQNSEVGIRLRFVFSGPEVVVNGKRIEWLDIEQTDEFVTRETSGLLALNDNVVALPSNLLGVGSVSELYVSMEEPLRVGLYESEPQEHTNALLDFSNARPRSCSDPNIAAPLERTRDGFALQISDEAVCLGTGFRLDTDAILSISYETSSKEGIGPQLCLVHEGAPGCINSTIVPQLLTMPDGWTRRTYQVPLRTGNYFFDLFAQGARDLAGEIMFRNVSVATHQKIVERQYTVSETFSDFSRERAVVISEPIEKIEVKVPIISETVKSLRAPFGYAMGFNCSLENLGLAGKIVGRSGVKYVAKDEGLSCDFLSLSGLDLTQAYVLFLRSANLAGREMKVSVFNMSTNRLNLEVLLSEENLYLLPPHKDGRGYSVNFETRSFGRLHSENVLEKVSLVPFPLNWIRHIRVGEEVTVEAHDLLTIDQSFDSGWAAYSQRYGFLVPTVVNSWQQAWFIPAGEHTVYIFYLPQLLQWLGFVVLVGAFAFLLKPFKK